MSSQRQDAALPPLGPEPEYSGYGPGAPYDEEEGGGLDFRRYLAAIFRYKWIVAGLAVLGLAGGVGASLLVKPMYAARAAVQVPGTGRQLGNASPLASAPLFEGPGWLELLRSFAVLDEVVRRRRTYLEYSQPADSVYFRSLAIDSVYQPGEYVVKGIGSGQVGLFRSTGEQLDVAAVGDSLGRPIGLRWVADVAPSPDGVPFRVRAPRDAAVRLAEGLEFGISRDGSIIRISLRGQDPRQTASVLNDVVLRFIEVATLLKREKLTTITNVLREQLGNSRIDLTRAETELERFKVETITLPSERGGAPIASGLAETRDPVREMFFDMRIDRDQLTRDRDAVRRALADGADGPSLTVSLGTLPSVRESRELTASLEQLTTRQAELRQLRVAFAPTHPQVQQAERDIALLQGQQIPQQAQNLVTDLERRIADLDARISASSQEMQQIPVRYTEEARLERNVQVAQMIYTQLQGAFEQARLAEISAAPDVNLLDQAVPPTRPESDKALQLIIFGLAGGIGLGIAIALLLDMFDPRIRRPEQVTKDLGLTILGALPMLKVGKKSGMPTRDDAAELVEATRATRMSLLYAHGAAGPFLTTVTSPGPGDGKSFTSANLARSFASSGRRTILIDGDNRRGALHRTLGVERKPGLMDFLSGAAELDDVIHTIAETGFDFIAGGTRMAAAPELLSSQKMQQLMLELRGRYQAIIIDSPPLGAGVDPLILASLTGTLVLVLRNGKTDGAFAEARLEALQRLPIRILGAILNDVSAEGNYRYYSYLPGYRSVDEVEDEEPIPRRLLGKS